MLSSITDANRNDIIEIMRSILVCLEIIISEENAVEKINRYTPEQTSVSSLNDIVNNIFEILLTDKFINFRDKLSKISANSRTFKARLKLVPELTHQQLQLAPDLINAIIACNADLMMHFGEIARSLDVNTCNSCLKLINVLHDMTAIKSFAISNNQGYGYSGYGYNDDGYNTYGSYGYNGYGYGDGGYGYSGYGYNGYGYNGYGYNGYGYNGYGYGGYGYNGYGYNGYGYNGYGYNGYGYNGYGYNGYGYNGYGYGGYGYNGYGYNGYGYNGYGYNGYGYGYYGYTLYIFISRAMFTIKTVVINLLFRSPEINIALEDEDDGINQDLDGDITDSFDPPLNNYPSIADDNTATNNCPNCCDPIRHAIYYAYDCFKGISNCCTSGPKTNEPGSIRINNEQVKIT